MCVSNLAKVSKSTLESLLSLATMSMSRSLEANGIESSRPDFNGDISNLPMGVYGSLERSPQIRFLCLALKNTRDFAFQQEEQQRRTRPASLLASWNILQPLSIAGTLGYQLQLRLGKFSSIYSIMLCIMLCIDCSYDYSRPSNSTARRERAT
jgi:hypothetical protein